MDLISKLLGAPVKEALSGVGDILGKFITDPNQKLQASLELSKIQSDLQEKMAEVDITFAQKQADVIEAEANSQSWMARNWRPSLMYMFIAIIGFDYLIAPIFSLHIAEVPPDMWALIKIGMGGYIIGRSAEKIADSMSPNNK